MLTPAEALAAQRRLRQGVSVAVPLPKEGEYVVIVPAASVAGLEDLDQTARMIVMWSGGAAARIETPRKLNPFVLVSGGFPRYAANAAITVIREVLSVAEPQRPQIGEITDGRKTA